MLIFLDKYHRIGTIGYPSTQFQKLVKINPIKWTESYRIFRIFIVYFDEKYRNFEFFQEETIYRIKKSKKKKNNFFQNIKSNEKYLGEKISKPFF